MAEIRNIITIDGPSGAGKSTISKMLAAKLQYTYLDTGAMYRVVGLQLKRAGLDLAAENANEKLVQLLDSLSMSLAPGEEASPQPSPAHPVFPPRSSRHASGWPKACG